MRFRVPNAVAALVENILSAAHNVGLFEEETWAEEQATVDAWRKLLLSEIGRDWPE